MYCNWLHNDKEPTIDALLTGAYDTSTWGVNPPGVFPRYTDAAGHMPGAKFWIPSIDEWIKAVHYDPHKDGPDQGGYWLYPNTSNTAPVPGRSPLTGGTGETNAGYANFDPSDWRSYSVGAYPDVQTPWGLLDASGGVAEWMEDWFGQPGTYRHWDGTANGFLIMHPSSPDLDLVYSGSASWPIAYDTRVGLRIASLVPSPSVLPCLACLFCTSLIRRRSAPMSG